MSVYPFAIDSDATILRVDDNITEIGGESINQLRDAVFATEVELGPNPSGSAGSVASRLSVSLNFDGTIKASALTSIGLATLPIVDNQVAGNAGIKEYKLALSYSTNDLHTLISSNTSLLNSLVTFSNATFSDLHAHIVGAQLLSDGTKARHVLSQIDLNSIPTDSRDPSFTWSGLVDKTGVSRPAVQAAQALLQINTDLVTHETTTVNAHQASAITVDVGNFIEIPPWANTVQKTVDYLDQAETLNLGLHRATQHANGIPRTARSEIITPDGYVQFGPGSNVIPPTPAFTYLVHAPNNTSVDDLSFGDDLIRFSPSNINFLFDAQFSQVKVGDTLTVNYNNGIQTKFLIDSLRYAPGSDWTVRINGTNLFDSDGYASATVRIDRPQADRDTAGILAVAAANPTPTGSFSNILSSVLVGHPRGACALGLGFDPGKLDANHYQLYLELYPTGNPADRVIQLPAIDVTGNAGLTPGAYTLDSVTSVLNDNFRQIGYNYRLMAFSYQGEVGLMLADAINHVSFAIISGANSSGKLITSSYLNNVIGGNTVDDFDALGFGPGAANFASAAYQTSFSDATSAQLPTQVIRPLKQREYVVNGRRLDKFAPTYLAIEDGFWPGTLTSRNPIGAFTVEVTYTIDLDLSPAGLKPGKTLVIQPAVAFSDPTYNDVDYGRFIIKTVSFSQPCGNVTAKTMITVINGLHASGSGFGFSSQPVLPVKIYFSSDSVGFDTEEVIDQNPTTAQYNRSHEIYIDQIGKTFSHERARMPRQVEDAQPSWLGTSKWHLLNVSPKLRGYLDTGSAKFNKFVRVYILTYNSISGEFTGYLGQRLNSSSTTIQRTGLLTTGRKNVPVKFYDETGIDYVELVFQETAVSPGTAILSTPNARFVDIEVFPSLELDPEVFLLATCEVNWSPTTNTDVIQYVRDARQFGSVSESELTTSALQYISAGDALLHGNGIIRGFDFDFINTTDNREVYFKGGIALVNGQIVAANNASVLIPRVYPYGSTLPQAVTWAICVNQNGELKPILVTATKTQFFATTTGTDSYYLPSVTFSELILNRKDLSPIALATAHIASFTIAPSDIQDVRRFIANETYNQNLVLTSDSSYGHFHSWPALVSWINNFGSLNNKVTVRGNFIFSAPLDLTGLNKKIILEGDGAYLTFNTPKGILLGSNVNLKNLNIIYVPGSLSYTANDIVNTGHGCIYATGPNNLTNWSIEDCLFSYSDPGTGTSQRPPFINFEIYTNQIVSDFKISNNQFIDATNTSAGKLQTALAIIFINDGLLTAPALVLNSSIDNNTVNYNQGIFVTTVVSSSGNLPRPGINCIGVQITHNTCGLIGVITSAVSNVNNSNTFPYGLTITNNTCHYIASLLSTGQHLNTLTPLVSALTYGLGQISVEDNFANWIHLTTQDGVNPREISILIVSRNNLTAYDTSLLLTLGVISTGTTTYNFAIMIFCYSNLPDNTSCRIIDNSCNYGFSSTGTFYNYTGGMWIMPSATIRGNIIKGFFRTIVGNFTDGVGIIAKSLSGSGTGSRNYLISNNEIYRGSGVINAYIASDTNQAGSGMVSDNFFDSLTIDGTATLLQVAPASSWTVERNINQTVVVQLKGFSGRLTVNNDAVGTEFSSFIEARDTVTTNVPTDRTIRYHYLDTGFINAGIWRIPLNDVLPRGVQVTNIVTSIYSIIAPSGSSNTHVKIKNTSFSEEVDGVLDGADHALSLTPVNVFRNSSVGTLFVEVFAQLTSSFEVDVYIDDLFITYHW